MKTLSILVFVIVVICGCTANDTCATGEYTKEGECCTYVCEIACPFGYVEGTCNCECISVEEDTVPDTNIDDIFAYEQIDPPMIPE